MSGTLIHNPQGAFRTVDDFRFGTDADGHPLQYGIGEAFQLRANAAVEAGEALMFVAPTASVPLSVTPMTAAADEQIFAGAAQNDAAIGESVVVVRSGFAIVQHDTSDIPAFGSVLLEPDATTGDFAVAADPVGGAGPAPAVVGLVLSAEIGTTNTCWAYVGWTPADDFTV